LAGAVMRLSGARRINRLRDGVKREFPLDN
jgi:hypothetical protein